MNAEENKNIAPVTTAPAAGSTESDRVTQPSLIRAIGRSRFGSSGKDGRCS